MTGLEQRLGLAPGARVAILHVDDVGMCHGANVAFLELARAGFVDTGSVMVPCPWFPEIAAAAARDPALDLGVHLTLTSEWAGYRWRPISTASPSSGLIDADGYFPRDCLALRTTLVPEAAEIEMRAQIDRALEAGIDATHLDTHMGAALIPELLDVTLRLARDYRLPLLLPRDVHSYAAVLRLGEIDPSRYTRAVEGLAAGDLPIVDHFRMTPGVPSAEAERAYRRLLTGILPGVTFMSLHCNVPGDIETIVPSRAHWRTDEYALFSRGAVHQWLNREGIVTAGFKEIREMWRSRS